MPIEPIDDASIAKARALLAQETESSINDLSQNKYLTYYTSLPLSVRDELPSTITNSSSPQNLLSHLKSAQTELLRVADSNNKTEKKLGLTLGGYMARQKGLKKKLDETHQASN